MGDEEWENRKKMLALGLTPKGEPIVEAPPPETEEEKTARLSKAKSKKRWGAMKGMHIFAEVKEEKAEEGPADW